MIGDVYECTQHVNDQLSAWNAQAVIVNKVKNLKLTDEPWIIFNYFNVKKNMPESQLELSFKVHDHLSDLCHKTFIQTDIKHGYFSVILHSEDWHIFIFTISGIEQLQLTQMSQESCSAGFTMSELMNILLEWISELSSELSLLHEDEGLSPPLTFYMNDIFDRHSDFESQFAFLRNHFFSCIEWRKMTLSFKKLRLFVSSIMTLSVKHMIDSQLNILKSWIKVIAKWPVSQDVKEVWRFLDFIDIICR